MNVVIAGATGFLGRPLVRSFAADGHAVVVLTRRPSPRAADAASTEAHWNPDREDGHVTRLIARADVVINLAGASIAERWTAAHKQRIRTSRLAATGRIVAAMADAPTPPLLINASAIGYYGNRGAERLTEASSPGGDFLARTCIEWEAAAMRAAPRARVALVRTGIVLERGGGALQPMMRAFKLFAGGPVGSGRQYMSWIHRADWLRLVRWIAEKPGADGPFNATAPHPVTNREFTRALGAALDRPSFMPAPGFALKIALGEMAGPLLLEGQCVVPARALEQGFTFEYPELRQALDAIVRAQG